MSDPKGRLPGEFALIAEYFAPLSSGFAGAFGLQDDAAVISPAADQDLVVKTDAIVAGVHFHTDDPADLIARKALRVNLSDLAGKGAVARAYMLDLILPKTTTPDWLSAFADGLAADQREFGVHLIGGDTNATPGPLTLAVTAIGEVPKGRMMRRDGANAGDEIFVTGTIGDAALGLKTLRGELSGLPLEETNFLVERYHLPQPPSGVGPMLLDIATATIDVSDGLIADLGHICETSGLGAILRSTDVPVSPSARLVLGRDPGILSTILSGGDDYEILFTAPPPARKAIAEISKSTGVAITPIGKMTEPADGETARISVLGADDKILAHPQTGWTHF
jgi:thiamine-monophosphate kinase